MRPLRLFQQTISLISAVNSLPTLNHEFSHIGALSNESFSFDWTTEPQTNILAPIAPNIAGREPPSHIVANDNTLHRRAAPWIRNCEHNTEKISQSFITAKYMARHAMFHVFAPPNTPSSRLRDKLWAGTNHQKLYSTLTPWLD